MHQVGHVRIDTAQKFNPVLLGFQGQWLEGIVDHGAQVEINQVQIEFTCFDLREVENIVDDPE